MFFTASIFSQTKIMAFGESTTAMIPAYRKTFYDLATADGFNIDMVGPNSDGTGLSYDGDNAGFIGFPCAELITKFDSFYINYNPDIILLLEGTNDCGWVYSEYWPVTTLSGVTRTPIVELSSLIDTICLKYPNTEIFVSTIPPMSNLAYAYIPARVGVANANVIVFNNAMPAMIALKVSAGKKIHFVDNRSVLTVADLSSDGIHPNTDGYNKIGTAFYTVVKNFMNNISMIDQTITFSTIPPKTYGDNDFTITANASSGLGVNFSSDNIAVATVTDNLIHIVGVGTVTITASQAGNTNYNSVSITQTFNVNKATLSVLAENKNKIYGQVNPILTFIYTGFIGLDTKSVLDVLPQISTSASQFSNVGYYSIIPIGGSDKNYDFVYISANLVIDKATLIATADAENKKFGEVNPIFTISYYGFIGSDDLGMIDTEPEASTIATQYSDPGIYQIEVNGGLDNNYNFFYISGLFTINSISIVTNVEINKVNEVTIYPNPVTNHELTIALNSKAQDVSLTVFNLGGLKVFFQKNITSLTSISLPQNLSTGLYFLIIKSDMFTIKKKIIIQ